MMYFNLTLILFIILNKSLLLLHLNNFLLIFDHYISITLSNKPLLRHLLLSNIFFICIVINHEVFQLLHIFVETKLSQGLIDIGLDNLFPLMFFGDVISTLFRVMSYSYIEWM